jgi:hypothetical protein
MLSVCIAAVAAAFPARVAVDYVNIRAEPSARAAVIGELERGDVVNVEACVPSCADPRGWALIAGGGVVARSALVDGPSDFAPSRATFIYGRVRGGDAVERERAADDAPIRERFRAGNDLAFRRDATLAAKGWLLRTGGGYVRSARIQMTTPSEFQGLIAPALPLELRDRVIGFVRKRPAAIAQDARWVHVDLQRQLLTAYQGDELVFATLVSTGNRLHRTPIGHYRVWHKAIHAAMHGDEPADPYFVDEVPYVMFFRRGLALHGTFWHDRFGRRTSHGCVNLSIADAAWLFAWAPPPLPEGWHAIEPEPARMATLDVIIEDRIAPSDRKLVPSE